MVKLVKTSIETNDVSCHIDNIRKTSFPVYYKGKVAIYVKFKRKDNSVSIVYENDGVKDLEAEQLKNIFDVALELINNFDVSFSVIRHKGISKDVSNLPEKIENDYVLIKKSIEDNKIKMVSTRKRDCLIKNNIYFVGYAGESSAPYQTNINNSEDIVGKYSTYAGEEKKLDIYLFVNNGDAFSSNKILINTGIWEQVFHLSNRSNRKTKKIILPDNKYINDGILSNRLSMFYQPLDIYNPMKNIVFDFSKINYCFDEYNTYINKYIDIFYEGIKTLKCNPVLILGAFYKTNKDNNTVDIINLYEKGILYKKDFIKWYERNDNNKLEI